MSKQKSKIILILDQEGTIYPKSSRIFHLVRKRTRDWISEQTNVKGKDFLTFYYQLEKDYPNFLEGIKSLGLSVKDYHKSVFNFDPQKYLNQDYGKKLQKYLADLEADIFIVTYSSKEYSKKVTSGLGINDFIKETYHFNDKTPPTKAFYYEKIAKQNKGIVTVIGDSYSMDIKPALELGFKTIQVGKRDSKGENFNLLDYLQSEINN